MGATTSIAEIPELGHKAEPTASAVVCRHVCCDNAREEVIERISDCPRAEDQVALPSRRVKKIHQQRAPGWPEHFELELDELRVLGVLGFELRGMGPRPAYRFRSGAVYTGQWSGNSREGFGKHQWPDGAQYEGLWSNSSAHGMGRFKFPDGSVYIGQWRSNRFHGLGCYYSSDGSSYRGAWVHGYCDGLGVEVRAGDEGTMQAAAYWGCFSRGMKDGPGVCKWEEGSKYSGEWQAGQISGSGMLVSEEGKRCYRGQWSCALKHGRGVYNWPDGREHQGQYRHDGASGFGSLSWPDGSRYEGFWRHGAVTGHGVFTDTDGSKGPLPPGLLSGSRHAAVPSRTIEAKGAQEEKEARITQEVEKMKLAAPQALGLELQVEKAESLERPESMESMDSTSPGCSSGSSLPPLPSTPSSINISEMSVLLETQPGALGLTPSLLKEATTDSPSSSVSREGSRMLKPLMAASRVTKHMLRRSTARVGGA
eukprot:TRINITY_DN51157_c0_g1_i1.p1 TRINITY_DN51157_c0_g1~~TRINITY_DN51157_c0_g1_i1.p1  ORF type:complete len:495 (-),score=97.58 TRINITY_DN51157_c0_g1_i1:126-1571(-)